MVVWVVLQSQMQGLRSVMALPLVERLVDTQPAKSVSIKISIKSEECQATATRTLVAVGHISSALVVSV